jgi:hypothetical protein
MDLEDIKKQNPLKLLELQRYTIHFIEVKAKKAVETNFQ